MPKALSALSSQVLTPPAALDPALLALTLFRVQKHLYAKLIMIPALLRLNLNTGACEELSNYVNPFPSRSRPAETQ